MKKIIVKHKFILMLFLTVFCYNDGFSQNFKKDEVYTYRSDKYEILKMNLSKKYLIDTTQSVKQVSYHTINWRERTITSTQYNHNSNKWEAFELKFNNVKKEDWGIKYEIESNECLNISLRNDNAFIYKLVNDEAYVYYNLVRVENKTLDSLHIYYRNKINRINNDSFEKASKVVKPKEVSKDFEYSDYWKKEAYKKVIEYMSKRIKKDDSNCKIIRQSYYNSNLVQYIGNQGFIIKYYCKFDCNQNYINQSYFWIEAYYLGYDKWDLKLIDQRLTH